MFMFVDNRLLSIISHVVFDFLEMVVYFMSMLRLAVQPEGNPSDISSAFAHVPSQRYQLSDIVVLKAAVCGGAEWD